MRPAVFDSLINNEVLFLADGALERGLVDTLARWDAVGEVAAGLAGSSLEDLGAGRLLALNLPTDDRWGEPPAIAVVYAVGVCAMDQGIKARTLSRTLQSLVDNPRFRAIVLRVDSPGGDGMASDLVSEVMRKARGKKPLIVSQGSVAASGGYWLSMFGDTIVAGPSTITGSIGVAGGWLYDSGLKEWLGMSTDLVKEGDHADLGFGFRFPILGIGLPDRNLTAEERTRIESAMRKMYTEFVGKVADGRGMTATGVDSVGQGRVWSGRDALERRLVDTIGGLETAIKVARARAGIDPRSEVSIVEYPEPPLLDLRSLLGQQVTGVEGDGLVRAVKFLAEHNGRPLPILSLDYIGLEDLE
jgi:protease-4